MTTSPRQRILLITRNLPPLVGGMERLNWHMAEELSRVADIRVIGPSGSAALAPAGVAVREAPLKPLWKFLLRARTLARREARAWKPDLVLAGSGLTAPLARFVARLCDAKTAVYVHGLDVAVKHPAYRALWHPALRRMDRVIANSNATAALCRDVGIDPARIGIVHPGVDFPKDPIPLDPPSQAKEEEKPIPFRMKVSVKESVAVAVAPFGTKESMKEGVAVTPFGTKGVAPQARGDEPREAQRSGDFRARHNLGNRPLLLSVGRLSARKGLREFVENALPQIVAAYPDVILLVIGDVPKDALHAAAQAPDDIRAAAKQTGVADNLRFLGRIADGELAAAYRASDVHVFPVREIPGDPEGFGMVAVEAAAHGLPTVAFAVGGVPDAVINGATGSLIQSEDYVAFAVCVNTWLARDDRGGIETSCIAAAARFGWPCFGLNLRESLRLATTGTSELS